MDLNDFIFRDDTTEPLGADTTDSEERGEETAGFLTPTKIGLAVIGSAVLGMSHFLGHATKHL
jgi:hypothetical protein